MAHARAQIEALLARAVKFGTKHLAGACQCVRVRARAEAVDADVRPRKDAALGACTRIQPLTDVALTGFVAPRKLQAWELFASRSLDSPMHRILSLAATTTLVAHAGCGVLAELAGSAARPSTQPATEGSETQAGSESASRSTRALPPEGSRLVVIALSLLSKHSESTEVDVHERRRKGDRIYRDVLPPGAEVVVRDSSDPDVASFYRQFPLARTFGASVPVRVVASPFAAQVGWHGWVHGATVAADPTSKPTQPFNGELTRRSFVCPNFDWTKSRCDVSANAGVKVNTLACNARSARVELWREDGTYVVGFVLRSQLTEHVCDGRPAHRDQDWTEKEYASWDAERRARADANYARQRASSLPMFVVGAKAWVCTDPASALAGRPCDGGKELIRGEDIRVLGDLPANGVWRSKFRVGGNERDGFIAMAAVNDYPAAEPFSAFDTWLETAPEAKLLADYELDYLTLLGNTERLRGRRYVGHMGTDLWNFGDTEAGTFTFSVRLHSRDPPSVFVLRNKEWVTQFTSSRKSYSCGPDYCDLISFSARFTGRTVDVPDARGNLKRLPLFEVEALADRQGLYRADAP